MSRFPFLTMAVALALATGSAIAAQPADLDARVEAAMRAHGVPGLAIAIVEDGKVALTQGWSTKARSSGTTRSSTTSRGSACMTPG